jgi:hypothetical protein
MTLYFHCIAWWEESCSRPRCVHIKVGTPFLTGSEQASKVLLDRILNVEVSRRGELPIARPRRFGA